jgi:acyl carrier protein
MTVEPTTRAPGVTADGPVTARADRQLSRSYAPARTEREEALVRLWQGRLRIEPIGVDDDFFELGGHSLMAAELLVDIQDRLGVEVTARTLFLQPTIAELAAAMEDGETGR